MFPQGTNGKRPAFYRGLERLPFPSRNGDVNSMSMASPWTKPFKLPRAPSSATFCLPIVASSPLTESIRSGSIRFGPTRGAPSRFGEMPVWR